MLIGLGWLAHALWDQVLRPGGSPGYVPVWYLPLCIGLDVYIDAALSLRLRR
jgi:hypothetical protein